MYVKVQVFPRAKKEKLLQKDELLELHVKEAATQNQANRRVKEMLAEHFSVLDKSVRLVSGHRSSRKIFSIDN